MQSLQPPPPFFARVSSCGWGFGLGSSQPPPPLQGLWDLEERRLSTPMAPPDTFECAPVVPCVGACADFSGAWPDCSFPRPQSLLLEGTNQAAHRRRLRSCAHVEQWVQRRSCPSAAASPCDAAPSPWLQPGRSAASASPAALISRWTRTVPLFNVCPIPSGRLTAWFLAPTPPPKG